MSGSRFDLNDPSIVKEFEKAAADHKREASSSPATARETLMKEGVLTKSGRLAPKYRSK
jgi:hypothetical protein